MDEVVKRASVFGGHPAGSAANTDTLAVLSNSVFLSYTLVESKPP